MGRVTLVSINFDFLRQQKLARTKHRPENFGAVVTMVLLYKNLHDHYGFGRTRFQYIMDQFERWVNEKWNITQKQVDDVVGKHGLDETLYRDYMQRCSKLVSKNVDDTYFRIMGREPVRNAKERQGYNEAAEITYKTVLLILTKYLGFGKKRLNDLQRYLKDDMWCILEGRVKLIEFMWMLHTSCAQEFGALDDWLEKYGKVYRDDGLPLWPNKIMYE